MSKISVTTPHSRSESYFLSSKEANPWKNRIKWITRITVGIALPLSIIELMSEPFDLSSISILFTICLIPLYLYLFDYLNILWQRLHIIFNSFWLVLLVYEMISSLIAQIPDLYPIDSVLRLTIPIIILITTMLYADSDQAWKLLRQDHLADLESPFVGVTNPINKIRQWINSNIRNRNSLTLNGFIITFSISFITISASSPLFEKLFTSTATALFASVVIISVFYLFKKSGRYIVIPFEVVNREKNSSELYSIANLITENLVVELQKIATLLHVQQVENLSLEEEGNNAFFVTSSTDEEFFKQLNQAVNLELPSTGSVSLGPFFHMIYRFIAKIRIHGKIQRRTNGSIEIQANLSYSSTSNATVNQVIIPESEIDSTSIQPIARNLAIKLLLDLGFISHLGTTHSSLDQMLQGLEASANRNWWLAISHYRQAIQEEESLNHKFGIGYFHLGTALLFLGNWEDGIEHLRSAERDGPLIPELQYMMALSLLFIYWGELHKKQNIFDEIIFRLESAETLRPTFPEATHLRGVTYYRRGRLRERWDTKWYGPRNTKPDESSKDDFKQSQTEYQRAYQIYDKILRKASSATNNSRITHNQKSSQVQQQLILSHLIADTLRVQNQYEKAIQYYDESLTVHPDNLRTLADMAKTYCLDENWKAAEEFLWGEAFTDDVAYWNADICIHMGWALAGGVQANKHDKEDTYNILLESMQFLDYSIHQRPRYITYYSQTDWFTPFNGATNQSLISSIGTVEDEDSTLQQIEEPPDKLAERHQIEDIISKSLSKFWEILNCIRNCWKPQTLDNGVDDKIEVPKEQAEVADNRVADENEAPKEQLVEAVDEKAMQEFLNCPFQYHKDHNDEQIKQLQLWLAFRIDTFNLFAHPDNMEDFEQERLYINDNWKKVAGSILVSLENHPKYHPFANYYKSLKKQRKEIIGFLNTIQNSKRNQGIYRSSQRLEQAKKLYRLWKMASNCWLKEVNINKIKLATRKEKKLARNPPSELSEKQIQEIQVLIPNLLDRIVIDILLEITLLTAKMLAESKAYELLFEVAEVGYQISTLWVQWWQASYKKTHFYKPDCNFIFNARVFRYQQASIYGWRAYATYFCREDSLSKSRIQSNKKKYVSGSHGSKAKTKLLKILSLNKHEWLEYIQSDINAARQHIFHHPLIMYMEALTLRKRGMADQAIVTYENLIDLIAPYDPKQAMGADTFGDYSPDKPTPNVFTHKRTYLRFMERVSGRQQFYTLIDRSRIHMEIADTYSELGKRHLRVEHLREAIRWSPHDDQDIDNLIRLANQLNNIERYQEASAVVDAIQRPARRLGLSQPSLSKQRTPQMLKCIIDTRSGNYSIAMENAKKLASNFKLTSKIHFVSPDNGENDKAFEKRLEDSLDTTQSLMKRYVEIPPSDSKDPFSKHRDDFSSIYDSITQKTLDMFDIKMDQIEDAEQSQNRQDEGVTSNTHLIKVLFIVAGHSKHQHPSFNNGKSIAEQILKVFKKVIHDENGKIQLVDIENKMRESQFSSNKTIRDILLDQLWDDLSSESHKYFDFIIASQIMHFLSVEASKSLSQLSELCNVLAYCRAQTGLHLPHAFLDSSCSVAINAYLMNSFEQNDRPRKALAKKMAQFCDTFGWVRFRYGMNLENPDFIPTGVVPMNNNSPVKYGLPHHMNSISIAEEFFRKGIRYDQERAIIYYHLARINLAKLEMLWQKHPYIVSAEVADNLFSYIDTYLIQVVQQHRSAKKYDKFGRLHIQLAWVYNIIMSYKRAWENRKYRAFAGDKTMNMYDTVENISQN